MWLRVTGNIAVTPASALCRSLCQTLFRVHPPRRKLSDLLDLPRSTPPVTTQRFRGVVKRRYWL